MRDLHCDKLDVFGSTRFHQNTLLKVERPGGGVSEYTSARLREILDGTSDSVDIFPKMLEYYVDSRNGSSGYDGTVDRPMATIDQAINLAAAVNTGDTDKVFKIHVAPRHTEIITAAAAIDADVDNLEIIGYGHGDDQAQVKWNHADATFAINADNVIVRGLRCTSTITGVTKGFDIEDGADDYAIIGCRFDCETLGTDEFVDAIFVTTSDRGIIAGNYIDMDEAGAASGIHFVGACLGAEVYGNVIQGDFSVGCVEGVTAAAEMLIFKNNTFINGVHSGLNTVACVSLFTGTTGFFENTNCYTNVTAAQTAAIAADGCFFGGGNWVATSAETAPLPIEGGTNGLVRSAVATGKADETDGLALFTVTGNIYVHGITQRAEVAADSAVLVGVQVDATDTTLDAVLVQDTNVSTETSVGDYAVSTAAGGSFTVVQVEDTTTSVMWDTPVLVPAGSIEQAASGTPGALVSGYIIYWSEATAGATCVAA